MIEKLTRFRDRAMTAFIIDDVSGVTPADAEAFKRFSDWVAENELKGECSAILGLCQTPDGKPMTRTTAPVVDPSYIAEVVSASANHLDAYMEVMTHSFLYDFATNRIGTGGPHEGVWLLDRSRNVDEYVEYFSNIARLAKSLGFRHAGLTLPGCGCEPCQGLYKAWKLGDTQATDLNRNVFAALLWLLTEQQLAAPVCGLFVGNVSQGPSDVRLMMEDGPCAAYDTPPSVAEDTFGRWDNDPKYVNIDRYITADGAGGRLPELIAQGTRTLIYYGHWQSLRPDRGIGVEAFREVARRLKRCYRDHIIWMRPSQIAAYRHTERHTQVRAAKATSFTLSIPFAPLHPVSFRFRGHSEVCLKTPSGEVISPSCSLPSEACAIFDLLPENGPYQVLQVGRGA